MSYILEALRKAERERRLGQAPTLEAVYAAAPVARRRPWPWLLLGAALLVNAGVVGWLWWPVEQNPPAVAAAPVATPAPVVAPALTPAPPPSNNNRAATTPRPVSVAVAPSTPSTASTPPTPSTPTTTPPAPPAAPRKKPEAARKTDPTANRPPEAEAKDPKVAKEPREKAASTANTAALPPAIQDLPLSVLRNAPDLNLDVHVYSETKGKRFVLINARRYREGEKLSEGPTLESITPEGAVLRHQGKRFLLPVNR
jgi:general secretion pathway protein B